MVPTSFQSPRKNCWKDHKLGQWKLRPLSRQILDCHICHGQSITNSYTTQEAKNMHEQQLLLRLKELRIQAKGYEEIEGAGGECRLPAFETTEEEIEVDEPEDE
ncbi:hypothetical protein EYC80_010434 [Monilinia laxa]|uniref:Uncharacterized protein n=1 Tax=Monilinia laxa TaxID=61186 RepID=A0A5N6JPG1_MONLA|nr:hypothetical protein EYC80_010434 [Monilinia laxa]